MAATAPVMAPEGDGHNSSGTPRARTVSDTTLPGPVGAAGAAGAHRQLDEFFGDLVVCCEFTCVDQIEQTVYV